MKKLLIIPCVYLISLLQTLLAQEIALPSGSVSFRVGSGGRFLIVPVRLGQQQLRMIVDTGTMMSGFDNSWRSALGEEQGMTTLATSAANVAVSTFDFPEIQLGSITVQPMGRAFAHDMGKLVAVFGEKVDGILGMDVLRQFVVQVDSDRGQLQLLKSLPPAVGQGDSYAKQPLWIDGVPRVNARCGNRSVDFILDTGASDISFDRWDFDRLVDRGTITPGPEIVSMTLSGESRSQIGLLRNLSVGSFNHADLNCSRDRLNTLGMRYLSRFVLVLDFPGRTLYLKKGRHFSDPDPHGTSGVALKSLEGRLIVVMVKEGSPAAQAGIRAGDELISINQRKTTDLDYFEIGNVLMSRPGTRLAIDVLRDQRLASFALVTTNRFELPHPPR